jgi:KaiC/GvpD/RAD55 family RecA-like ATPase
MNEPVPLTPGAEEDLDFVPELAEALRRLDRQAGDEPVFVLPSPPVEARQDPPEVEVVVFPSRGFQSALLDVMVQAADEFDSCVLIAATLPYTTLVRKAAAVGLDMQRFRVIDMVSAVDRNGFHDSGRVAYVSSPTLLEKAILLAFDAVHDAGEGRHCLLVDSMSTLGFYNSDVALEQFTHRLTSLARMSDWGARFLMNDHPKNRDLLDQVAHLFDGVSAFEGATTAAPADASGPRDVPEPVHH